VAELGAVLTGSHPGRSAPDGVTLFDSTGLAIQDLALCLALIEAHRARARARRLGPALKL
jgi:ornithine cyclodeaminase/alanine dehydrogenase-like protein (mu-crystallin family)